MEDLGEETRRGRTWGDEIWARERGSGPGAMRGEVFRLGEARKTTVIPKYLSLGETFSSAGWHWL